MRAHASSDNQPPSAPALYLPLEEVGLVENSVEYSASLGEQDANEGDGAEDQDDEENGAGSASSRSLSPLSSHRTNDDNDTSQRGSRNHEEPEYSYAYEGEKDEDGNPHGYGVCVYGSSGAKYDGEWKHGEADGTGKFVYPNGSW
jgi:hypothetical protein